MARGVFERTKYLDSSIPSFKVALEAFNSPTNPYRFESAFVLMVNSFELLGKATLLKLGENINDGNTGRTIPAEKVINKLLHKKEIEELEHQALQQLVSLRNEATHGYLQAVDPDLALFLVYSGYKFFEKLINTHFKARKNIFKDNYLSISTRENKTYADSVVGLLKSKKDGDRRLLYLLERGVRYSGTGYISQESFEKDFKKNKRKRLENKAAVGKFLTEADLLKVVFVQAPKHYSVDVSLGRNKNKNSRDILPVEVTTRLECDKNTSEIAALVGCRPYDVQKFIKDHKIKGNQTYHQEIPNGKSPPLHRYSVKLADLINRKGV